jgi:photosystem II stability/assembly factor-like uncharacterized protein
VRYRCAAIIVASVLLSSARTASEGPGRFNDALLDAFEYRNLGPFRAGSWLTDFAAPESPAYDHLTTFYVATRNGGVWKTTNNGTTFQPLFDDQDVSSIGAIAVAPSDPNLVWVGTGEAYQARSSYSGDGVYKSVDAGRSWMHMGLGDSHHVARIIIHPTNPDIVYVAAMGHLWTINDERGVFRTTDGGRNWTKVLYINERVGVIDLVMNRGNPEELYAAAYEVDRKPWHLEEGGPGSGIHKTIDGGRTWQKLENGLPSGKIGRIGIDMYQKNPQLLYAIVENANPRSRTDETAGRGGGRGAQASGPQPIGGEVYRTEDGGASWRKTHGMDVNVGGKAPYSFNIIRIDPGNSQRIVVTSDSLPNSEDGGTTWSDLSFGNRRLFRSMFGDVRNVWFDPQNPKRVVLLSDGGLHISYDGGITADHYTNLPLGEMYAIGVDMEDPYNVYAGLQDHESWKGPSNSPNGRSIGLEDWVTVGTGDGMYNQVDPTDSRWLYNTQEFGTPRRVDQLTHSRTVITPPAPSGERLRFNWVAPIRLSPHDPKTIYVGAQMLFRSTDRGDTWQQISPDLTTNDKEKIAQNGPSIRFCTISTFSESPAAAGVIWVGTDDGKVQVTRDAGGSWNDVTRRITAAGGPAELWVSRVFASKFDAGTAYVSKTGFRADNFRPYLFRTTDYGRTWTSISAGLPDKPLNVIVEDVVNRDLLFVGNDRGVYVSIDGGAHWSALRANMPTVPVHDLVIHPRENDLVVGTYGRGMWITDIGPLREMSASTLETELHLFDIEPKAPRGEGAWGNYQLYGDRYNKTPNEQDALAIVYYVRDGADKATVTIADAAGEIIRTFDAPARRGVNRAFWNLRNDRREPYPIGDYTVTVTVGLQRATKIGKIRSRDSSAGTSSVVSLL